MPPGSVRTTTSQRAVHHQAYRRRVLWPLIAAPAVLAVGVWRTNTGIEDDLTAKTQTVLGTQLVSADFSAQDGTICVTGDPQASRQALGGLTGAVKLDVRNCPAAPAAPAPSGTEPSGTTPEATDPPAAPSATVPVSVGGVTVPLTSPSSTGESQPLTSAPPSSTSSTSPGGSQPSTSASTPIADRLQFSVAYDGDLFVLDGVVESDAQRRSLVKAATAAADDDATKVVDRLTVVAPSTPTKDAEVTVANFGGLLERFPATMARAELGFDVRPTLSGTYLDAAAKSTIERAAQKAGIAEADTSLTARIVPTATQQATLVEQINAMLVKQTITFEPNLAVITEESTALLDAAAAKLNQFDLTGVTIQIDGYTDSDGNADGNVALSQLRANAVRVELVARKVPRNSLTAVGHGAADPIAPNDTPENKAKNRRVTFSVKSS